MNEKRIEVGKLLNELWESYSSGDRINGLPSPETSLCKALGLDEVNYKATIIYDDQQGKQDEPDEPPMGDKGYYKYHPNTVEGKVERAVRPLRERIAALEKDRHNHDEAYRLHCGYNKLTHKPPAPAEPIVTPERQAECARCKHYTGAACSHPDFTMDYKHCKEEGDGNS